MLQFYHLYLTFVSIQFLEFNIHMFNVDFSYFSSSIVTWINRFKIIKFKILLNDYFKLINKYIDIDIRK